MTLLKEQIEKKYDVLPTNAVEMDAYENKCLSILYIWKK